MEQIDRLVANGLAKIVTFVLTDEQIRTEYDRVQASYNGQYSTQFNKKNTAQLLVRQCIKIFYPDWCEIRFSPSKSSSSIWFNGEEVSVVIKRKYQRHADFPKHNRIDWGAILARTSA